MKTKILVIDNNIDQPWSHCAEFRRYLQGGEIVVRRAPERDLPVRTDDFTHILISGSKTCILDSSPWVQSLMDYARRGIDAGIPTLGVCYGHQIIARAYGGDTVVRVSPTPEIGWVEIEQTALNPLLEGLPPKFYSFQAHFEEVRNMPPGFIATASTSRCPIQAYYVEGKPVYGVQFHPERDASEGQESIDKRKKQVPAVPKGCIFGDGQAKSLFSEHVARTIFGNFLKQRRG